MINYKHNFDVMFENVVEPLLDEIKDDFKKSGFKLRCFKFLSKSIMKWVFVKEANTFVQSYMVNNTLEIDKHKIAACLMKSIVCAKPFKVPFLEKVKITFYKNNYPKEYFLVNQYLALSAAVTVLESYIKSDAQKKLKHKIVFPEPFVNGEKNYICDVCLDLYYSKPKRINVVTYANVFFLLEKYSCRKKQCDRIEQKLLQLLFDSGKSKEDAEKILTDTKFD